MKMKERLLLLVTCVLLCVVSSLQAAISVYVVKSGKLRLEMYGS